MPKHRYLINYRGSWSIYESDAKRIGWPSYVTDVIYLADSSKWIIENSKRIPWYMNRHIDEGELLLLMLQVKDV